MTSPESQTYQSNLEVLVQNRTEQLRQAMSDLETARDCTVQAYGDALLWKDTAAGDHSKRVTVFSIALSRAMQMDSHQIREIARAAFLHDIGKLRVSDEILRKATPLSESEMATMKSHCALGYEMVRKISFLSDAAEMIHAHHERWDGAGYPRGLKGENIHFGARIISVVNVFDNISSRQWHKPVRPFESAAQEISGASGTQFDPQVVKVFLSVPQSTWLDIVKELENRKDA